MTEQILKASRVRLKFAAPSGPRGATSYDWIEGQGVTDLKASTNGFAMCRVDGKELGATYVHAEFADGSIEQWDNSGAYTCPDCGQEFVNAQGLGSHRAQRHPPVTAQPQGSQKQAGKR